MNDFLDDFGEDEMDDELNSPFDVTDPEDDNEDYYNYIFGSNEDEAEEYAELSF